MRLKFKDFVADEWMQKVMWQLHKAASRDVKGKEGVAFPCNSSKKSRNG